MVVDDLFSISQESANTPPQDSLAVHSLNRAEGVYAKFDVVGSDEKTVPGADRFKVIGAEVASDSKCRGAGLAAVSAPIAKRFALAALSLPIATLPIVSRELASLGWQLGVYFDVQAAHDLSSS